MLDVGRCAELVAVFFGVACEALCRYSHVFTIQDRTQTSASVPCGWSFSRGCGIGSGCCGGGVILLGLRESALLCQGLLFEPKASSAPGTMILADSRSLSSIRRRIPARTDVTSPAYVRSTIPAYAPSTLRTLLPCTEKDGHPKPRQPPFPHTSYIGNRNIEKIYLLTLLTVLPARKALILSTVISIILCLEACAAQEICGVMMQFLALRSGLSPLIGSVETTSRPAA